MTWSKPHFDPIILPDGRKLATLRDVAIYITALPKAKHALVVTALRTAVNMMTVDNSPKAVAFASARAAKSPPWVLTVEGRTQ